MQSQGPIEARRLNLGMSRAVLADKAGITRESVRLIEIGKSKPNAATLKAIADVLGCSVMDLLTTEAAA